MPADGNGRPSRAASGGAMLEVTHGLASNGRDHVIVLIGELDCASEAVLQPILDHLADGADDVRLDMRDVTFLDVRGLHVLGHAARTLHDHGRHLVVEHPSRAVSRLLELARPTNGDDLIGLMLDPDATSVAVGSGAAVTGAR